MYYLGIDVSKDSFATHLILDDGRSSRSASFKISKRGFNSLYAWLRKSGVVFDELKVVMEATGVYWQRLFYFLNSKGVSVAVLNPAQIKDFIKSYLRRGKTDPMDARMIALYALERGPESSFVPEEALVDLKLLVAERDHIVKLITKERNRLHAHNYRQSCPKALLRLINKRLRALKIQLADIELLILSCIKSSEHLKRVYDLLISLPGVAFITAIVIIAQSNALIGFVSAKQLAAYAGIAPAPNQSGSFKGYSRISKIGNPRLREALYMAALSAVRASEHFANFKARLEAKHKPKKLIYTAVARKLLVTAWAVVKSDTAFDPEYYKKYSFVNSQAF